MICTYYGTSLCIYLCSAIFRGCLTLTYAYEYMAQAWEYMLARIAYISSLMMTMMMTMVVMVMVMLMAMMMMVMDSTGY